MCHCVTVLPSAVGKICQNTHMSCSACDIKSSRSLCYELESKTLKGMHMKEDKDRDTLSKCIMGSRATQLSTFFIILCTNFMAVSYTITAASSQSIVTVFIKTSRWRCNDMKEVSDRTVEIYVFWIWIWIWSSISGPLPHQSRMSL